MESERVPLLSTSTEGLRYPRMFKAMGYMAQLGLLLFVGSVASVLLSTDWILFSWHPVGMCGLLVGLNEGILLLQPTTTPTEKQRGLIRHRNVQLIAYISALFGATIIIVNKASHNANHFTSVHGKLGLTTLCYLLVQVVFGLSMVYVPSLFGGVAKAKALWKYHRLSGYILVILAWVTAEFGAHADFMIKNWPLSDGKGLWIYIVAAILGGVGIVGRIRLGKLGIQVARE